MLNTEEGEYYLLPLTTIGPANLSLVEEATHLIDRVDGADAILPRDYQVPWRLIVRDCG